MQEVEKPIIKKFLIIGNKRCNTYVFYRKPAMFFVYIFNVSYLWLIESN